MKHNDNEGGDTEGRELKIARFGDNMRQVAVTEGDKVEAQIKFGWAVNGYGIGDLVKLVNEVSDAEANKLLDEYAELYEITPDGRTEGQVIINEVDAVRPEKKMPKLPVARILWRPHPSLKDAAEAWILAGGAHHTAFSFDITVEHMMDWAEMAGIECLVINKDMNMMSFRNELRWNDVIWRFR